MVIVRPSVHGHVVEEDGLLGFVDTDVQVGLIALGEAVQVLYGYAGSGILLVLVGKGDVHVELQVGSGRHGCNGCGGNEELLRKQQCAAGLLCGCGRLEHTGRAPVAVVTMS